MPDYRRMNMKTIVKTTKQAGLPVPPLPENATEEQKKAARAMMANALEHHDEEALAAAGVVETPVGDATEVPAEDSSIYPPERPPEPKPMVAGPISEIHIAGDAVPTSVYCKNCGRDLLAIDDYQVMLPPGFTGAPNKDLVLDQAYCSGCAVAANSQLPLRDRWTVVPVKRVG